MKINQEEMANILRPSKSDLIKPIEHFDSYRPKSSLQNKSTIGQRLPSAQMQPLNGGVKYKQIIYKKKNNLFNEQLLSCEKKNRIDKMKTTQDDCNDYNLLLLDDLSVQDPIWKELIPVGYSLNDETLQKMFNDNPGYFYHNLKLCACYKCKCGRCKCEYDGKLKLGFNGGYKTNYDSDYFSKMRGPINNLKRVTQKTYETKFSDQQTIDLTSQYQQNYQEMQLEPSQKHTQQFKTKAGHVSYLTNYRENFNDWGREYKKFIPSPHISTSQDIRFNGVTQYQSSYQSPNQWNIQNAHYFKSTLTPVPNGPFSSETTHLSSFQPYKLSPQPIVQQKKIDITPSFEGQYMSMKNKDFQPKEDEQCPAKQFQKLFRQKLQERQRGKKNISLKKY